MKIMARDAIEFYTTRINEVHIDLEREALLHIAKDADAVIIRVQVFAQSGRPATRSLRIPRQLLEEPQEDPNPF